MGVCVCVRVCGEGLSKVFFFSSLLFVFRFSFFVLTLKEPCYSSFHVLKMFSVKNKDNYFIYCSCVLLFILIAFNYLF